MMTLYSDPADHNAHRVRLLLCEKAAPFRVIDVDDPAGPDAASHPKDIRVPTLIEGDLILYDANIISEYIDGRYPQPQLLPSDPMLRAKTRLLLFRMEKELFSRLPDTVRGSAQAAESARRAVVDHLAPMAPVFSRQRFLLGKEFSMLDVAMSTLLWRLDHYRVSLPPACEPIRAYAERLFARPAFSLSLTPQERAMRK